MVAHVKLVGGPYDGQYRAMYGVELPIFEPVIKDLLSMTSDREIKAIKKGHYEVDPCEAGQRIAKWIPV